MLDRNDKQWITEVLDEKLSNTKTELRGEMQEMEGRLHGEMQEMENNITDKVVEKLSDSVLDVLATQVNILFENTYQKYMKLIGENVPDKIRSYDRIDEKQQKHQDEIEMLRSIAYSHENRIARLEKVAY